ncbi:hypothetical protein L486_05707 [Kwoniella mangroviensis CBS 10435]|uniref:Major facilitator superfamily (MFS) profile domain-containing protein n=1 Tax=Kwoniella mangroviensis CBS 10435 TaxID=1331196 RepID=A0A1B9IMR0_9TREE|nr:hypothetical protein L486_05707 [Kwoniella mangroviensis CBS 10435]
MDVIQQIPETKATHDFIKDQLDNATSPEHRSGKSDEPPLPVRLDSPCRLSNTNLFILGTGQVFLWGLTSASILETAFALPVIGVELDLTPGEVQAASNLLQEGYNLASLSVFRALAGIASAIALPASAGIIGSLYPAGRLRTLAFAAITCGGAAGAAGGELVADKAVDWLGACAIGSSIFLLLLTFTLSETEERGWKTPHLPALLVASVLFFAVFAWRQRQLSRSAKNPYNKKPPPLIPLSLLSVKNRNLVVIYIASACTWAMTDSFFVFASYLYFDVLNLSPFQAGLRLSITFFSGTVAALVVALTSSHISPRLLMTLGCLISVVIPVIFAVRGLDWAYWKGDIWALLVIAYGTDATIAAGSTIISQTASPEDQSVASALFQTSCRLGFALGLAISTLVQTSVEKSALSSYAISTGEQKLNALVDGLRAAQWCNAGYVALAAVLVGFGMKGWQRLDHHTASNDDQTDLHREAD